MDETAVALGVLRIANFDMESAIRLVTTQKGIDVRTCTLIAFGGAGPVHAVSVARELGIKRVIVPLAPGNVNAFGALIADSRYDFHRSFSHRLESVTDAGLHAALQALEAEAQESVMDLAAAGHAAFTFEQSVDARYVGQGFELTVPLPVPDEVSDWRLALRDAFTQMHQSQYKTHDPEGDIELLTLRMSAVRHAEAIRLQAAWKSRNGGGGATTARSRMVRFAGAPQPHEAAVYDRGDLQVGQRFTGPAIVEEHGSTTVIPAGCEVEVDALENLVLTLEGAS
jgi:N-methylhydantoinase A